MRISDVIRQKGSTVVTIAPQESVRDLIRLLTDHRIGAVIVSPDGSQVAGIVSERDVVKHLNSDGVGLLDQSVESIMTTNVVTCRPSDDLEEVATIMTQRRFRHLPVVVDDRLQAIVSIGDIVKNRIDALQAERDHLVGYIQQ